MRTFCIELPFTAVKQGTFCGSTVQGSWRTVLVSESGKPNTQTCCIEFQLSESKILMITRILPIITFQYIVYLLIYKSRPFSGQQKCFFKQKIDLERIGQSQTRVCYANIKNLLSVSSEFTISRGSKLVAALLSCRFYYNFLSLITSKF